MASMEVNNISSNITARELNNDFVKLVWPVSFVIAGFSFVGILGNIFVLYVHIFKYPTCNFRYFVLGLCAVDLTSSVTILPLEVFSQLNWFLFPYEWLCKLKAFLHVFLSVCSVYVLLLIAIDRFRKVCAPHGWQMKAPSIMKGYVICIVLAMVQSFPVVIVYGLNRYAKPYKGHMVYVDVCGTDPAVRHTAWPKAFFAMMFPNMFAMVVMVFLYMFVARRIFGVVKKMRKASVRRMPSRVEKNDQVNEEEDNDVFEESGPNSSSLIDSKLRDEIVPLNKNKNVKMVAYKVCNSEIFLERGNSMKTNITNNKVRLTLEELERLEENASKMTLRKSDSSVDTYMEESSERSRSRSRSRGLSTGSTIHESTEDEIKENKEHEKIESGMDTIKSVARSLRRKSLFQKRVKFSQLARDKLKRRTLITFVFTAVYIITTLTYIFIAGHVVNGDEDDHSSFSELAVLIFFYRLYFINNVIHPIIYGALDPKFRKTINNTSKKILDSVWRSHHDVEDNVYTAAPQNSPKCENGIQG